MVVFGTVVSELVRRQVLVDRCDPCSALLACSALLGCSAPCQICQPAYSAASPTYTRTAFMLALVLVLLITELSITRVETNVPLQLSSVTYRIIQDYTGLYRTIRDYMGLYGTIRDYTGLYGTIRDYMGLYGTIRDYTGLYRTIRDYTRLYGTIQD